jgi:SAM-dependent methyltransferase
VEHLSARVRAAIKNQYTDEQLAQMSIVDIGCYDGWLLESLSDLPFGRMIGIEPRRENIERGRRVREILRIASRVEYQRGEIDTLGPSDTFDIVLCMGVLHHVESIPASLRKLRAACRRMLFIETACLPSCHLTPHLKRDVELKDVVYRYKPQTFGITAQKYESQYYPGSGVRFSVVNVPTPESLHMHLDVLGFRDVKVVLDWDRYRIAMPQNERPVNLICLSAMVDEENRTEAGSEERKWVADYESRLATTVLPEQLIVPLYEVVCEGGARGGLSIRSRLLRLFVNGPKWARYWTSRLLPWIVTNTTHREIVGVFPYNAIDKIRLEYGKHLLARGNLGQGMEELQKITRRANADWRACYRAFYLLWRAAILLENEAEAERYRNLCLTCNPHYPLSLFHAPPPFA